MGGLTVVVYGSSGCWAEKWRGFGSSPKEDKNMEGVLVEGEHFQSTA